MAKFPKLRIHTALFFMYVVRSIKIRLQRIIKNVKLLQFFTNSFRQIFKDTAGVSRHGWVPVAALLRCWPGSGQCSGARGHPPPSRGESRPHPFPGLQCQQQHLRPPQPVEVQGRLPRGHVRGLSSRCSSCVWGRSARRDLQKIHWACVQLQETSGDWRVWSENKEMEAIKGQTLEKTQC